MGPRRWQLQDVRSEISRLKSLEHGVDTVDNEKSTRAHHAAQNGLHRRADRSNKSISYLNALAPDE